jgi:hypothetical protein
MAILYLKMLLKVYKKMEGGESHFLFENWPIDGGGDRVGNTWRDWVI